MPGARLRAPRFGAAGRQYRAFSGIAHGRGTTRFFENLIAGGFATPIVAGPPDRGRIYHVHYKPWHRALGVQDHPHHRAMSVGQAVETFMVLVALLAEPLGLVPAPGPSDQTVLAARRLCTS